MIQVGIVGATGYVGQQLVWLMHQHPKCNIQFITSNSYSETSFSEVYGQYTGAIQNKCIKIQEVDGHLSNTDVVFIALPHGMAFDMAKKCYENNIKVIDMGADFRLKDADIYNQWYNVEHQAVDLISKAVYGLPEIHKEKIKKARVIGNPGCYPTASILGLLPLFKSTVVDKSSIIIDAKSGVSGAGRSPKVDNLYGELNESFKAYSIASHRHTPEIEQELSSVSEEEIKLSFTPHLVPMSRGILVTCYGNLNKKITIQELYDVYHEEYKDDYFVRILDQLPQTRWVKGSNFCDIALRIDERTNRVIIVSAIDNMMKGAASQGVQNMNLMFGFDETMGLEILPMVP